MSTQKQTTTYQIPLWVWLIPFLLFAAYMGIRGLDADIIWLDERFMLDDSRVGKDLGMLAYHLSLTNPWHVPGYFILLNLWGRIHAWTWDPMILRIPALYMGLIGIAFTYRLGREHISPRVGLFASIILSVSGFFLYFLHEARMYSTNIMFVASLLWLYLRMINPKNKITWRSYLLLLIGFSAALYTHYFLLTVLGGIGIYHLLFAPKNRRWWNIVAMGVLAIVSFTPWIVTFLGIIDRMSVSDVSGYLDPVTLLTIITTEFSNGLLIFLIITAGFAIYSLRRYQGYKRFTTGAILWCTVFALTAIVLTNEALNIIPERRLRYLVLLWPLLSTVVAIGIVEIDALVPKRRLSLAVMVLWVGIASWYTISGNAVKTLPVVHLEYPMNTVSRELHELHQPGDFVVHMIPPMTLQSERFRWYELVLPNYSEFEDLAVNSAVIDLDPIESVEEEFPELIENLNVGQLRDYLWFGYMADDQSVMETATPIIEEITGYISCGQQAERDGAFITQFAQNIVCCYDEARDDDNLVTYASAALEAVDSTLTGDTLSFWTATSAQPDLPQDMYSMGVYVVDADGEVVGQVDTPFPQTDFVCTNQTIAVPDLPDGEYTIVTSVYDWRTGQRIIGEDGIELPQIATVSIEDSEYTITSP